jgi:hypothetical protein
MSKSVANPVESRMKKTTITLGALALFGCGEHGDQAAPDAGRNLTGLEAPADGEGIQLSTALRVEPGEETIDCRYLALPGEAIEVGRFEHAYTPGSHHMLVYPTDRRPDQVELDRSFECGGRGDLGQTGVLYGGSEPTGELPYPDGVAVRLEAGAVLLLESHYLNTSDQPIDAEVRVNLWYPEAPAAIEAGTLFFRDWAIYLPPAPAEGTASMSCAIPDDVSLFYATSHMHRRGVDFGSRLLSGDASPRPLHDSDSWAAPLPAVYSPPLELAAGDRIEFTCGFKNDRSEPVIEGASADSDEMCVFIAGYWPRMSPEAELCLGAGSGPILTGSQSCEETVTCMLEAGVGDQVGGQACIADTCAGSAASLSSFVVCVEENDCWGSERCVASRCAGQWTACTAATCAD